jgi:hypothetical protein
MNSNAATINAIRDTPACSGASFTSATSISPCATASVAPPVGVGDAAVATARHRDALVGDPQVGGHETAARVGPDATGNPHWSCCRPQDSKTICTRGVG